MVNDITPLQDAFFQQSLEGLEASEQVLLRFDLTGSDEEAINSISQITHSIKAGAEEFELSAVADFTHLIASLLAPLRIGEGKITADLKKTLLASVDVVKALLSAVQNNTAVNQPQIDAVKQQIRVIDKMSQKLVEATHIEIPVKQTLGELAKAALTELAVWDIKFNPDSGIFKREHDPVQIFQDLSMLGELTVVVNDEGLPLFSDLEPDSCYLSWHLRLSGKINEQEINKIFGQVRDDCELSIEQLDSNLYDTHDDDDEAGEKVHIVVSERVKSHPEPDHQKTERQHKYQAKIDAVTSMQVETSKIDALMNLLGELVMTQSMLSQVSDNFSLDSLSALTDGLEQLERDTRSMQGAIMQIRMLPISSIFSQLPVLVDDLCQQLGKKVNLKFSGEHTEIDKTVLEKLVNPLVHLIRDALEHGLETPEARRLVGKVETGTLDIITDTQGENIIIDISDDGVGIDNDKVLRKAMRQGLVSNEALLSPEAIQNLIFRPEFSELDGDSDLACRGIGTDSISESIADMGGSIKVSSVLGSRTTFTLRLPIAHTIIDGQIVKVAGQDYILPLIAIIESLEIEPALVKRVSEKGELYPFHGDYVPILRLYQLFNLPPTTTQLEQGLLVIVDADGQKVGLFVDELIAHQQVVIKSLEQNYRRVAGFSGAAMTGKGVVALMLDISGLVNLYKNSSLAGVAMSEGGREM
ncbi:MAG: two-component system chemotaxis sensor kinase CheA [Methylophagaceae bacterium]|jgi:two-component system chemotaxis sensor kinase CheA